MANRDDRTDSPSQNRDENLDRSRSDERMRGGVSGDTRGRAEEDDEEFEEADDDAEMMDEEDEDDGR